MTSYIQVMTTVNNEADAETIASALVSQRLAACVQVIGPISSTYWWQGNLETSEEWLCLIKTRADLYPALDSLIHQVHPYDVPEILAVPVVAGAKNYLAWLDSELRTPSA